MSEITKILNSIPEGDQDNSETDKNEIVTQVNLTKGCKVKKKSAE